MIKEVKKHVKKHKVVYSCGVTAVVVAGITYLIMRESHAVLRGGADWSERTSVSSLNFFSKNSGNIVTTVHKGIQGHPGYITRCIETGELFATQGDAARTFNIPEALLSGHLNKGLELSENLHFERLGVLS